MRFSHKLFLVLGALVVAVAIALTVPAIVAANDSRQGDLVSDGDLCVEIDPEPVSGGDLSAYLLEEEPVSDGNLQFDPDYDSTLAGTYDEDRMKNYCGSRDFELFYIYGFCDKYGNFRYVAPGFDERESYAIANGYIKYAEDIGIRDYVEQYCDLSFDEFLQAYIDSGYESVSDFLLYGVLGQDPNWMP